MNISQQYPFPTDKRFFLLVFVSVFMLLCVLSKAWFATYLISSLVVPFAVFNPSLAVAFWLSCLAYEPIFTANEVFSLYKILSPGLILGWGLRKMFLPYDDRFSMTSIFLFVFVLIVISLIIFLGGSFDSFYACISIAILVSVVFISLDGASGCSRNTFYIFSGIAIASVVCLIYAALIYEGGWRLTLTPGWGGGVRAIDQILSLGIVSVSALLYGTNRYWRSRSAVKLVLIFLFLIFVAGLMAVVARGALLGLLAFGFTYFLMRMMSGVRIKRKRVVINVFVLGLALSSGVLGFYLINKFFSNGLLFVKIAEVINNPSENLRWQIWGSIISSVLKANPYFGLGLTEVESSEGYYAHSLYISIFGSLGLVGASFFIILLFVQYFRTLRELNALAFSATSYFVVSYATSGALSSKPVWAAVVLVLLVTAFTSSENGEGPKEINGSSKSRT